MEIAKYVNTRSFHGRCWTGVEILQHFTALTRGNNPRRTSYLGFANRRVLGALFCIFNVPPASWMWSLSGAAVSFPKDTSVNFGASGAAVAPA